MTIITHYCDGETINEVIFSDEDIQKLVNHEPVTIFHGNNTRTEYLTSKAAEEKWKFYIKNAKRKPVKEEV